MALSESALKKLHKDEIINLALDYQSKFDSMLAGIRNELSDLKKYFEQLRSDLSVTKLVNTKLKEKVVSLERQTWSNSQYSRRGCLELSGIPETIESKDLEGTALDIFEKLDVMVDPSIVEDCHWIKSSKGPRKVIVKLSRRKDANKIRSLKKGLKCMNLSSLGVNSTVYINDSLCTYYKMLWGKCRKLLLNKYFYSFWVTNGTIKLKTVENGRVYAITHRNDLVELFPDNEILADQVETARLFFKVMIQITFHYRFTFFSLHFCFQKVMF